MMASGPLRGREWRTVAAHRLDHPGTVREGTR